MIKKQKEKKEKERRQREGDVRDLIQLLQYEHLFSASFSR